MWLIVIKGYLLAILIGYTAHLFEDFLRMRKEDRQFYNEK